MALVRGADNVWREGEDAELDRYETELGVFLEEFGDFSEGLDLNHHDKSLVRRSSPVGRFGIRRYARFSEI